jgi:ATP-dependent DNA helicase RecQ
MDAVDRRCAGAYNQRMTFDLTSALQQHFGLASFRHSQEIAIGHVLAGRDTLVVMPTGAGKSLIYQLPALLLEGTTLVISPLVALMKDQVDQLAAAGKRATFINSTLVAAEQARRAEQLAQGAYALAYAAPERLRSPAFTRALARAHITRVAVDEAHCISQWGHDFRPDYLNLRAAIEQVGRPPVTALTATATPQVQDDIATQLGLRTPARLVTGFNRPNLTFEVQHARDDADKLQRLRVLIAGTTGSVMIYTGTRRQAEEIGAWLEQWGVRGAVYHAGLDGQARRRVQEAFMRGQLRAIVATNAFGMGVDKPDVRLVAHYSLPGTVEAYYQEAGRGGRDGLPARCVLLYMPKDIDLQEWFIANDAPDQRGLRALLEAITRLAPPGGGALVRVAAEHLATATGLNDVKLRVGVSLLEKERLPAQITYEQIRCVLASLDKW